MNYTIEELKTIPTLNLPTYVTYVTHLAKVIEALNGIYYLVPIVQSAHESRQGNSGLARNHCNLFGMKVNKKWLAEGKPVANMKTGEHIGGKDIIDVQPFKHYSSWLESFIDWNRLMSSAPVYKKAYELLKNKETVKDGITEMGRVYATDPAYTRKLIDLYDYVDS